MKKILEKLFFHGDVRLLLLKYIRANFKSIGSLVLITCFFVRQNRFGALIQTFSQKTAKNQISGRFPSCLSNPNCRVPPSNAPDNESFVPGQVQPCLPGADWDQSPEHDRAFPKTL